MGIVATRLTLRHAVEYHLLAFTQWFAPVAVPVKLSYHPRSPKTGGPAWVNPYAANG